MHSKFDLNLFNVLVAIYEQGSITAAANQLCLTQPAVSHALGRLRELLDDPLFERQGRRMVPTRRCHTMLPNVQKALESLYVSASQTESADLRSVTRTVNLGLRDVTESALLPPLLKQLCDHAPKVQLRSTHVPMADISQKLEKGELDIAIDAMMPVNHHIMQMPVRQESFVLLCRPGHAIEKRPGLKTYIQSRHVLVSVKRSEVNHVDMALAQQGYRRNIALICEHYLAAARIASESDYLLTLPRIYLEAILKVVPLSVLPVPMALPLLPVHMYWHCATDKEPLLENVREWLLTICNGLNNDRAGQTFDAFAAG